MQQVLENLLQALTLLLLVILILNLDTSKQRKCSKKKPIYISEKTENHYVDWLFATTSHPFIHKYYKYEISLTKIDSLYVYEEIPVYIIFGFE